LRTEEEESERGVVLSLERKRRRSVSGGDQEGGAERKGAPHYVGFGGRRWEGRGDVRLGLTSVAYI